MDPNTILAEILKISGMIRDEELEEEDVPEAARKLVDLVDSLDDWLKEGGFLPSRWRR